MIIGVSTGRSRDYIGITEKNVDTAILFTGYIYIYILALYRVYRDTGREKTNCYIFARVFIAVFLGLHRDNGKELGNHYIMIGVCHPTSGQGLKSSHSSFSLGFREV